MNVVLLNPLSNFGVEPYGQPPLGLGYIASNLKAHGHKVKIIDRPVIKHFHNEDLDKITLAACKQADLIGISCISDQFLDTKRVVDGLKKFKGKIIIGGCHPTALPDETLNYIPRIDGVVVGEGEEAMLNIANGIPLEKIPEVYTKKKCNTKHGCITNLDSVPSIDYNLFNMNYYTTKVATFISYVVTSGVAMVTSRGCIGRCKFCACPLMHKTIRFHSPERTIENIEHVRSFGVNTVSFVDEMFAANKSRVEKICNMMIQKKWPEQGFRWTCNLRVDYVDSKLIGLMKKAGLFYLIFGLESGSNRMLEKMGKNATVEQALKAIKIVREHKIAINSTFIIGLPEETEEDLKKTYDFIKKIDIQVAPVTTLMVLPGCEYFDIIKPKFDPARTGRTPKNIDEIENFGNVPMDKFRKWYIRLRNLAYRKSWKFYSKTAWKTKPISIAIGAASIVKNRVKEKVL